MRILFLHRNFPAQFRHLAEHLARDPGNEVVYGTAKPDSPYRMPGVRRVAFRQPPEPPPGTHPYLRSTDRAVRTGQSVVRMCAQLARDGFSPDVIIAHSGWGPGLYVKEVFPRAQLLVHVEWYFRTRGADLGFLPPELETRNPDRDLATVTGNLATLHDLAVADAVWVPTAFQAAQLPATAPGRVTVLHEGIDTTYFSPTPTEPAAGTAPRNVAGLHLAPDAELLTYATRGMEPYRGFPQFLRAAATLLEARPRLHAVVAGEDRVVYGTPLPTGDSWRRRMVAELGPRLDPSRVHFVGGLPYRSYVDLLRASDAHVYLTVPFVLSWGMLEAMACGVRLVASATPPVQEVVTDGRDGLLVDFFDADALAARVADVLDRPAEHRALGVTARQTIVDRYDLHRLLPRQEALVRAVAEGATR